ncbi:LacI family DNA-binding transcriptional regulator [Notoacmeibacter marinus]|uniref:LacI family DNA-binding transcriptional regulator n=1 Tax=Notoacmeibacter marinus TaxID=1876515 RepID=UPI000DF405C9|nr:LacI family DNA-binding transcriptional regulator [Notoacmeibacter marinus]
MRTPTLHDVAHLAGVSYATADRVLNRRGNVAEKSVRKVEDAVHELGYVRDIAAANLSRKRRQRLAFVLPRRSHPFFGRMHEQLTRAVPHLRTARVEIDIVDFEAFDAASLEAAISGLADRGYHGIAVAGHGRAATQMLKAMREAGTRIVSLVSDRPEESRDHYIGIDNVKAGRTVARLVGMAHAGQTGRVVLAAGSMGASDHGDRIAGFRDVMARDFPSIAISDVIETRDRSDLMHTRLHEALTEVDATAIYNVGAGNEGLIEVARTAEGRRPFTVVHELSAPCREALEEGTVDVAIDQRPEIETSRAIAWLRAVVDDLPPPPAPELIPAIYVRDNLPDDSLL